MKRLFFLLPLVSSLVSLPAFAQESKDDGLNVEVIDGQRVGYKKVTEIEIEGADVDGALQGPHINLTSERKIGVFNPLIHLRTDFNPEMNASIEQIK